MRGRDRSAARTQLLVDLETHVLENVWGSYMCTRVHGKLHERFRLQG